MTNPLSLEQRYKVIGIRKEIGCCPALWIAELENKNFAGHAHLEIDYQVGELTINYYYEGLPEEQWKENEVLVFLLRWGNCGDMRCEEMIKLTELVIDWSAIDIEELKKQD